MHSTLIHNLSNKSFYFLLSFFLSCTSSIHNFKDQSRKNIQTSHQSYKGERPSWISEPGENCPKISLCASSSGENSQVADLNALNSLAAIFETRVDSQVSVGTYSKESSQRKTNVDSHFQDFSEDVSMEVNQQVQASLSSAEITRRFNDGDVHYSFIELNRSQSAQILKAQMRSIVLEMENLFKENLRSNRLRLMYLFEKNLALQHKLVIVDNRYIINHSRNKNWFEQIQNLQTLNTDIPVKIVLKEQENRPNSKLINVIESYLQQCGIKLFSSPENSSLVTLKISIMANQEFLQVSGFEKWSFQISLQTYSGDNLNPLGTLNLKEVVTARNYLSARLMLDDTIKVKLKEEFHLLKIP